MLYVPMFKTRQEEICVIKELNECFNDNLIPLIEVLDEFYETQYKKDELTGEYIRVQAKKQMRRVKLEPTEDDIRTLKIITEITGNKEVFIDYFRYTTKKYGTDIKIEKLVLARKLNDDFDLYKSKVFELIEHDNIIPVISIKNGFSITTGELTDMIRVIKNGNSKVAIRLTDEFIDSLGGVLQNELDVKDYVLLDIEEQVPKSKFMEYEEVDDLDLKANVIVLNSPRQVKPKNGDYPENSYTSLIDNSVKDYVVEYNFAGYGDYCGLKDTLPSTGGGNGQGAALALIYDYEENAFWAYTNKNVEEGMRGYKKLIPKILADRDKFDPDKTCSGFNKIADIKNGGNWGTWLNICARRYLWQVSENLN
jgi:hypothetical protein